MPTCRAKLSASRGFSSTDRVVLSSSYSEPIVFGWRKCLCDDREMLVTLHGSKNTRGMESYCNHFRWADEIDGGIDEVVAKAVDEHKKRIVRMQKKLNSESKKGRMLLAVALLS
ncbi:hypothetical protein JHK82_055493 [Glycine max]|nr:hypothetical protein JHK86_055325 [Glycine max]KAG4909473.1 hypothetical protein JHK87_055589 [Glycine soja]KAG4918051.1 hypothetical protein JHK85_056332 [Glycine max]KAG5074130.1 hypothetical protein JHK84_055361 [Glycine max]KAG5076798.1 hypothetical protein JHK82_055493 [Glycine max]